MKSLGKWALVTLSLQNDLVFRICHSFCFVCCLQWLQVAFTKKVIVIIMHSIKIWVHCSCCVCVRVPRAPAHTDLCRGGEATVDMVELNMYFVVHVALYCLIFMHCKKVFCVLLSTFV